jgi:hypothetical protein
VIAVAVANGLITGRGGWVWDPAGPDEMLSAACRELEAGRFGLASEALAETRLDFAARARRSMVMASVAAAGDGEVARHWLREQRENPDAVLLWARTAVVLALRSPQDPAQWTVLAERACYRAATAYPDDPTPWVAWLALARVGARLHGTVRQGWAAYWSRHMPFGPREHPDELDARWRRRIARSLGGHAPHRPVAYRQANNRAEAAAEYLGLLEGLGPWDLMLEVWARDPRSREGHHRMLELLSPRFGGSTQAMAQFAAMVSIAAPDSHELRLLPLAARLEVFRATGHAAWSDPGARQACQNAYHDWFLPLRRSGAPVPTADGSLLAHALYQAGERTYAIGVITAMSPYTWPGPWSLTDPHGDGEAGFLAAVRALNVPTPRRLSGWERRELSG